MQSDNRELTRVVKGPPAGLGTSYTKSIRNGRDKEGYLPGEIDKKDKTKVHKGQPVGVGIGSDAIKSVMEEVERYRQKNRDKCGTVAVIRGAESKRELAKAQAKATRERTAKSEAEGIISAIGKYPGKLDEWAKQIKRMGSKQRQVLKSNLLAVSVKAASLAEEL